MAVYVYCVIRAARPPRIEAAGVDPRQPLFTVQHQGLAAVASDVPSGPVEQTRAHLLAHERVNAAVLRAHTVVPMSFGAVFRSRDDVVEMLRLAQRTFEDVLGKMEGKVEYGLKVSWDREGVIAAIAKEDGEVRQLQEEVAQCGAFAARMQYGRRVDAALARRTEVCVADLLRRLRGACVTSRCNDTIGERMILNAAFLVERSREAEFDRQVQALSDDHPELDFQLTGPWPPYNFVAIRLKGEALG